MDPTIITTIVEIIKILIIGTALMLSFAAMTLIERKALARFTLRYGPNRAGKFGLLQPIADMFKMFFKEEVIPTHVDRLVYLIAPALALVPALIGFAVVPLASQPFVLPFSQRLFGASIEITPWVADVNVGLLYILAVGSLGTYGVILAGWSSNNKYSLLGGLRTGAQMLSYELPMGAALLSVTLMAGTLRLNELVQLQGLWGGLGWFIFIQPVAFIVFFISALAEAGRSPFDLPETENELIGGFVTEYGGMKFGLFFGAEYVHAVVLSFIASTIFLGGWQGPGVNAYPFLGVIYLLIKVTLVIFLILWIRASVPRVRFDKMMQFCWKFLLPLGILNLIVTAIGVAVYNSILGHW
ncbi:MAG: NADH-quinone oxidoreductase subunit NuoH [Anaerolineae bacterium]|nr:NADH-quinone oxidoreductase subunit NuoH [Anaerolineae bacterium]